jgi:hypothetical protein
MVCSREEEEETLILYAREKGRMPLNQTLPFLFLC